MKGDFTRDTFDPAQHFSRVLMQQGRVQLDADFNEQMAILLHHMRTAIVDLIGPYGRPAKVEGSDNNDAFKITTSGKRVTIAPGRYYVAGILCQNTSPVRYENVLDDNKTYFAYLDVWERHLTYVQDDGIREKALGGPDTCSRAEIAWQVRLQVATDAADTAADRQKLEQELKALERRFKAAAEDKRKKLQAEIDKRREQIEAMGAQLAISCAGAKAWVGRLPRISNAVMKARLQPEGSNDDACSLPPESRYRGTENQLYRIELHRNGVAWDGTVGSDGKPAGNAQQAATFKWSRDNGSIVFPIVHQQGNLVTVQSLGRDERTSLKIGDWVEIMDDDHELQGTPGILARVDKVDLVAMTVTLKLPDDVPSSGPSWPTYDEKSANHPLLRRWDHRATEGVILSQGAILVTESSGPGSGWLAIENGIEVQFQPSLDRLSICAKRYRTGDYWLIPARVATGTIEWPVTHGEGSETEMPRAQPPRGVMHFYAPLAIIKPGQTPPEDCRCTFHPLLCESV